MFSIEILSCVYQEDDLICMGKLNSPKTKSIGEWKADGTNGDLFCPNPMRVEVGINKEGKSPRVAEIMPEGGSQSYMNAMS